MNDPVDKTLDALLDKGFKYGIRELEYPDRFYIRIIFGNGSDFEMWNANRYYGWLSNGTMTANGYTYKWNGARPKKKTIRKLIREIRKFSINKMGYADEALESTIKELKSNENIGRKE
jgi:hypothetical protein